VQVSRVTKVVKGGKQLAFRAVIVIGNKAGRVGVGVAKAKEVIVAVQKAVTDAKKNLQDVPITATSSVPHKLTVPGCGSSQVMIRPALEGSGITAGGSVRAVLELAGYRNVNAKMLAGSNPLNNGRATLDALSQMRTPEMVARIRDLTTEEMEVRTRSARMAPSGL
jgi:small subunit ribosomal protein S5